MRIAVFGANGPTGRLLVDQLSNAGHSAVAVTRHPETFPSTGPEVSVTRADVFDRQSVAEAVHATDAVISLLGVPFTRNKVNTFSTGTSNIVTALGGTEIRRLVVVSSTGAHRYRNRRDTSLPLRIAGPVISRTIGKTVYDDLRRMEDIVHDSQLDWTIVRPSTLFDSERLSTYTAGEVAPIGLFTARIDLAHYLTTLIDDPTTVGATPIVSTTEGVPSFWQTVKREAFTPR